jgi:hypothetical protein
MGGGALGKVDLNIRTSTIPFFKLSLTDRPAPAADGATPPVATYTSSVKERPQIATAWKYPSLEKSMSLFSCDERGPTKIMLLPSVVPASTRFIEVPSKISLFDDTTATLTPVMGRPVIPSTILNFIFVQHPNNPSKQTPRKTLASQLKGRRIQLPSKV